MRKIIILGWGNSQRQDDGLARIALERLELTGLPPEVELVHADQLLPEHAAIASQADVLIFVDASTTGPPERSESSESLRTENFRVRPTICPHPHC
jgi:hydrogenase maturation protease